MGAKLEKLLSALKLQADIPRRYHALTRFAEENGSLDSCEALAKLRNGYVHPTARNRRIVFGADGSAATFNAWQLSLWYQELALLRVLDYRRKLRKPDDRRMGGGNRARTVEQFVVTLQVPTAEFQTDECCATHPSDSTSACSSTVRVAISCLSGG